jgi:hypothetical protein
VARAGLSPWGSDHGLQVQTVWRPICVHVMPREHANASATVANSKNPPTNAIAIVLIPGSPVTGGMLLITDRAASRPHAPPGPCPRLGERAQQCEAAPQVAVFIGLALCHFDFLLVAFLFDQLDQVPDLGRGDCRYGWFWIGVGFHTHR